MWGGANFVSDTLQLGAVGADFAVDFQNDIDLNGGPRTVKAQNGTANIDGILSGVVSNGTLQKLGGGTLALTGDNSYAGGTLVNEGRLLVNNTAGSGVGSGDVTVDAGVLGGSGFIGTSGDTSNVAVNNSARLAPGSSAGELTVFGNVTFSATTTFFDVELADGGFDKLTVNGTASLNGTLNVALLEGYTPAGGTTFEILSASGGLGATTFSSVILPSPDWQVSYMTNSVVLTAPTVGLAGDYNNDNVVDTADYIVWRKSPADFGGDPAGYDTWRANFGATLGSGNGAGGGFAVGQAVPEPASIVLLVLAAPLLAWRRRGSPTA
jgi:autotransporter-associated beta strand protein